LSPLLAVPNVSEGRDLDVLDAIGAAFEAGGARLLDRHEDADHHRAVFTLAGGPGALAAAVLHGAREALARIDLTRHAGEHPRVGAIDVAPIVYLDDASRGAACAEALVLADLLGRVGLPVYLYGALAGGRTRAELRRGGPQALIANFFARNLLVRTAAEKLVGIARKAPLPEFSTYSFRSWFRRRTKDAGRRTKASINAPTFVIRRSSRRQQPPVPNAPR